jgi:hypothetical protein
LGHGRPGFSGEDDASGAESESAARNQSALGSGEKSEAVEKSGMKKQRGPEARHTPRPVPFDIVTPDNAIHSLSYLSMRFKGSFLNRRTHGRLTAS